MKDEEILSKIAQRWDAQRPADEILDELANGKRSVESARAALGQDPGIETTLAAYTPLDDHFKDAVTEQLLAQAGPRVAPTASASSRGATPWRYWARRSWPFATGAVGLAAAAAALIAVMRPPLPPYSAEFSGGEVTMRSAEPQAPTVPRLQADSRVEWVLRPASEVRGSIAVRGFLVSDNEIRAWPVPFEVSPQGAVRISGRVADLGIPAGQWTLALAVGRPRKLPENPDAIAARLRAGDTGRAKPWQLATQSVVVQR